MIFSKNKRTVKVKKEVLESLLHSFTTTNNLYCTDVISAIKHRNGVSWKTNFKEEIKTLKNLLK